MGCPYIVNEVDRGIVTGGAMRCPECNGTRIDSNSPKAPLGCVCMACGHILCVLPKC